MKKIQNLCVIILVGALLLLLASCGDVSFGKTEVTPSPTPVVDVVPVVTETPAPAAAAPSTTACRVRADTGMVYATFNRGDVVQLVGTWENYYALEVNGVGVFVEKDFIRLSYEAVPDETSFTAAGDFYIYGNVYMTDDPVAFVKKGTNVKVLDQFGGYLFVDVGGVTGYVPEYVTGTKLEASYTTGRTQADITGTTVTSGGTVAGGNTVTPGTTDPATTTAPGTNATPEPGTTATPEPGSTATPEPGSTDPTPTPTWRGVANEIIGNIPTPTPTPAATTSPSNPTSPTPTPGQSTTNPTPTPTWQGYIGGVIGGLTSPTPAPANTPAAGETAVSERRGQLTGVSNVSGTIKPMQAIGTILTDDAGAYYTFYTRGDSVNVIWHDSHSCIVFLNGLYGSVDPRLVQYPGAEDYTIRSMYATEGAVLYRNFNMTSSVLNIAIGTELLVLDAFDTCVLAELGGNIGYVPIGCVSEVRS